MMKIQFVLLTLFFVAISGCKKENGPATSGTATIESTLHGTGPYFAYGFSFSQAGLVKTTASPGPDITLYASKNLDGSLKEISLETDNFNSSFSLKGEYTTEDEARTAFKGLLEVGSPQWIASALPLRKNQVWLFRTAEGKYVKIRVISTVEEMIQIVPYGSCTFEWVCQPDGSTTFTSK